MKEYKPEVVDTSSIVLPEDLVALTEKIAENTHNVWAIGRIKEGWRYGEKRDDTLKTTPCLVDYHDLPESEKEYDRNTSIETIKLILSLGYKIISPGNVSELSSPEDEEAGVKSDE